MTIKMAYADLEKFKSYCKNNDIVIVNLTFSDIVECIIEISDTQRETLLADVKGENNYNILEIDTIRQKNISVLSN